MHQQLSLFRMIAFLLGVVLGFCWSPTSVQAKPVIDVEETFGTSSSESLTKDPPSSGISSPGSLNPEQGTTGGRLPTHAKSYDIANEAEFLSLSRELNGERYTKFVVDLRSNEIVFFDVNAYQLHSDFVFAEIYRTPKSKTKLRAYNRNYSTEKPEMLLGYISHYLASDRWTFAFWEGDTVLPRHVKVAYEKLKQSTYFGKKLFYRPDSQWQERLATGLKGIPSVRNEEIYEQSPHQVLNSGQAIGRLKILRDRSEMGQTEFSSGDILLSTFPLGEIPTVAGIISEKFSGPLSQINLQAKRLGIPHVGMREALNRLSHLEGRTVVLIGDENGVLVREASALERVSHLQETGLKRTISLSNVSFKDREIQSLSKIKWKMEENCGVRAEVLSRYTELYGAREIGEGFVLPFSHFHEFYTEPDLRRMREYFENEASWENPEQLSAALTALQKRTQTLPLSKETLERLEKAIPVQWQKEGVKLQLSTSADRLSEFAELGFHERFCRSGETACLEHAIRDLWSQMWSPRLFQRYSKSPFPLENYAAAILIRPARPPGMVYGSLLSNHIYDPMDRSTFSIELRQTQGALDWGETLLFDYKNRGLRILNHQAMQDQKGKLRFAKELILSPKEIDQISRVALNLRGLFPLGTIIQMTFTFRAPELRIESFAVGSLR